MKRLTTLILIATLAMAGQSIARDGAGGAGDGNGREYVRVFKKSNAYSANGGNTANSNTGTIDVEIVSLNLTHHSRNLPTPPPPPPPPSPPPSHNDDCMACP